MCQRVRALDAHAHGALFADDAPDPVTLFGSELKVPLFIEQGGCGLRIAGGQLDERQCHKFFAAARDRHFFIRQKPRGVGLQ